MTRSTTVRRGGAALGLTAAALAVATAFTGAAQAAEASWTLVPTGTETPNLWASLEDVETIAADDVWAVGGIAGTGGQALHWDGASVKTTDLPADVFLYDIESGGDGSLWTAGITFNNATAHDTPLALRWDGARWVDMKAPAPKNIDTIEYGAMDVAEDGEVWLVGTAYRNRVGNPFTLHWDGRAWDLDEFKIPKGAEDSYLTEVLAADGVVYAAGWDKVYDPARGFYLTSMNMRVFDGADWSPMPIPALTPGDGWISDLAVDPATGLLNAAGHRLTDNAGNAAPMLAAWDGSAWTESVLPQTNTLIQSLAFDGEGHALLVGDEPFVVHPHALYFDGSAWSEIKSPWGAEIGTYLTGAAFVPGGGEVWLSGAVPTESGAPNGNVLARGTIS